MPGSLHRWYSFSWLDMLAERQSVLSGEIELKRLARLRDMLHADDGSVTAELRFRKRSGAWVIVELKCEATLALRCQRCLEPMLHAVEARVELGLHGLSTARHRGNTEENVINGCSAKT